VFLETFLGTTCGVFWGGCAGAGVGPLGQVYLEPAHGHEGP
jgi:hypothetical protein